MNLTKFIHGDCRHILAEPPAEKVHMVFVDPPYNIRTNRPLLRPNATLVDPISHSTATFETDAAYDAFTHDWLTGVRTYMRSDATIWVMGSYHSIFRIGNLMQDMGFWILNSIAWHKPNAMPNFNGTRLRNDVEFIIWAKHTQDSRYTFHYHDMKARNGGKQMGSMWSMPTCVGSERLRDAEGNKLHPTQKPLALVERMVLLSTNPGDLILDPFAGTGTLAVVAKATGRRSLNIEYEQRYVQAAKARAAATEAGIVEPMELPDQRRVAFEQLVDLELLQIGQVLYLRNTRHTAIVQPGGKVISHGFVGSIHQVASHLRGLPACNGWNAWDYRDPTSGERQVLNNLRERARGMLDNSDDQHTHENSTP